MAVLVVCEKCGARFRAADEHRSKRTECPDCSHGLVVDGSRVPDHDVFISYSSRDKVAADAVCRFLEDHNVRCWIAPRNITPGVVWAKAIMEALTECQVMVLVFSEGANDSQHVVRELEQAVQRDVPIITLRLGDLAPSPEISYFISTSHWLDATDAGGAPRHQGNRMWVRW